MPSRNKINLEKVKASLFALCPECGYKVQSGEYRRVDGERLRCPKCSAAGVLLYRCLLAELKPAFFLESLHGWKIAHA